MTKKLNESKSEVIEKNLLEQDPDGYRTSENVIITTKHIPEMLKITFLNGRDPGCALDFHYASATVPFTRYTFYHGFDHVLPVEVIEHLEDRCENQYAYRKTAQGDIEQYVKSKKNIFQCKNPRKIA